MKKPMSPKKSIAIFSPFIALVAIIMVAVIVASSIFWQDISLFLYGRSQTADAAALESGDALCEDIVEEGVVLLKNEKQGDKFALPLTKEEAAKINVFGWAAYDWMTMAFGSGYTNTSLPKTKLFPALKEAGIEYNKDLYDLYEKFYSNGKKVYGDQDLLEYRGGVSFGSEEIFVLREPNYDAYTDDIKNSIIAHSDVALVVIGRTGSESKDLRLIQTKQKQTPGKNTTVVANDRHYLQLSTEEEDMIRVAKETCDKVIVVLNTANTMETGFIDDKEIDAALLVGLTGLKGVHGLINVLRGEKEEDVPERDADGNVKYDEDGNIIYKKDDKGNVEKQTVKVSPSGRTADTYAYDILGTNPSTVNQGSTGAAKAYSGVSQNRYDSYIDYSEGIYVGYKWYETADAMGFWSDKTRGDKTGYEAVVQYPFGYGLSYTDFKWSVSDVKVNDKSKKSGTLDKDDKIEIYVDVKNNGSYPGADVVQLYYTAPYTSGKIEKSEINLADFAKTGVIEPGKSARVKLEISVQQMASYDCYDANGNGHTGYELDAGEYKLRLMKNSHTAGDMNDKKDAVITFTVPAVNYDKDEVTQNSVENRFTNKDGKGNDKAIDNGDLDGSREAVPVTYLSRADFKTTYPKKQASRTRTAEAAEVAALKKPTEDQLKATGDDKYTSRTPVSNGLKLSDMADVKTYDDESWADLLANVTNAELVNLVKDGYFKTAKIDSIEKPEFVDLDGPLGFNTRVTGGKGTTCEFMSYPSATLLAQTWNVELAYAMGLSVGREAKSMKALKGWYAPGANIHRNPFGGRNGEYYSEDGVLSGKICAGTVKGAKDMGIYSYVKHFVCNDSELSREGLFTFLTEQALRETYLKPFEIMIKRGGGNAIMTSMNRLGRVWSGGNYGLCTEILRNEWGFRGTLVTDWCNISDDYMPPYRGIWAGNDIWLTNGLGDGLFKGLNDATAYNLAEKVAHNVLWTVTDCNLAAAAFDPNNVSGDLSVGAEYNLVWIWYIVLIELALGAGLGVMVFFLVKNLMAAKKGDRADE